jgi:hypothetical protein
MFALDLLVANHRAVRPMFAALRRGANRLFPALRRADADAYRAFADDSKAAEVFRIKARQTLDPRPSAGLQRDRRDGRHLGATPRGRRREARSGDPWDCSAA